MATIPSNFNLPNKEQIPDHSILDIYGKQAYLGNQYALPLLDASAPDMTERPVGLIVNPASSKKSLFIDIQNLSCDSTSITRFYANPTVTSAGTPVIPPNVRPANANVSISICSKSPSVSSNGTLLTVAIVFISTYGQLIIIDPGQSLLITNQATATGSNTAIQTSWYEL